MVASNFDRSFALTLKHEGGYVDNPRDPGGATNLGITIGTLSTWLGRPATKAEVRALTPDKARPIYRRNYWDKIGADSMEPGMDFAAYDFAVNSGPSRAIKYARAAVGATRQDRIRSLCAARLAFLRGLSTWSTFGKGWSRRVADVEKQALAMSGGSVGGWVVGGGGVVLGGGTAVAAGVPPIVVLLIIAGIAGVAAFVILRKRGIDPIKAIKALIKRQ